MKKNRLKYSLSLLFVFAIQAWGYAQYIEPLKIPSALSANFGELRNNHFHSGLDFKTQQAVNKPIYAVADGFVSRISVSPGGYGLALYLDHPELGHTTVYGHLNSFSKHIAEYVEEKQYEQESFRVNLFLEPHEIPVTQGEQIALSGNTGSSGGPHLHFEIRDTETQAPLDPLHYVAKDVRDTQSPDLRAVAFYPIEQEGVINGAKRPLRLNVAKGKNGNSLPLQQKITAWGKIGLGVKAYDKMDGQANIYGVKHVRLYVDEQLVFGSTIDKYLFSDTRMLNSFIDFEDWRNNRSMFMKSFVEPGNKLQFYNIVNKGYISINEERAFNIRYELEDYFGNTTQYKIIVHGVPQEIDKNVKCKNWMKWNEENRFVAYDFTLNIEEENLYSSFCFSHSSSEDRSQRYYSNIHKVNNAPVPLHKNGKMWLKLNSDTLPNRDKYGVVKINPTNNRRSWIGGIYKNGGVELSVSELGDSYAIDIDSVPPRIEPINPAAWKQNGQIRIKLGDNLSGIHFFRGTIDGEFVLFTHDAKSSIYTYRFNRERLQDLPVKNFKFVARDGAGNESVYEYEM